MMVVSKRKEHIKNCKLMSTCFKYLRLTESTSKRPQLQQRKRNKKCQINLMAWWKKSKKNRYLIRRYLMKNYIKNSNSSKERKTNSNLKILTMVNLWKMKPKRSYMWALRLISALLIYLVDGPSLLSLLYCSQQENISIYQLKVQKTNGQVKTKKIRSSPLGISCG